MKNLFDYINESILDDEDDLIQDVKNSTVWFNIIKQSLIKHTESGGSYSTRREVYDWVVNNEIIKSTLKKVFKKPDDFKWNDLFYSDLYSTYIKLSDSKRGNYWMSVQWIIRFNYKPNKYFKIELKKPEHLEQTVANKIRMKKYIELIEDIKKIAKKDWTEPISLYYIFEI